MQFCIQDPSYDNSMYLHETLLSICKHSLAGAGAYAFATSDGIDILLGDESFKSFMNKGTFYLIVGMDDITNTKALETLKKYKEAYGSKITIKAYVHNSRGSTFHPKYSWFRTKEGGVLVIGSGNLTQNGLRHNREAYGVCVENADNFNVIVEKAPVLIGRNGKTIESLQIITNDYLKQELGFPYRIYIDICDYKKQKEVKFIRLAKQIAKDVARTGCEIKLDPMNSYERRIIHNALANNKEVRTESFGEEPNRYVVIKPRD